MRRLEKVFGIKRLERLVRQALEELPDFVKEKINDVNVVVQEEPSSEIIDEFLDDPDEEIFGLYEGDTVSGPSFFDTPRIGGETILIFRGPLLRYCRSRKEVVEEIRDTVIHEVAHHFGIDDRRLHELDWD